MKKLLVLVLVVISLTSLVSCSCECGNYVKKGQVWVVYVYPSGKPTDSLMFLILDVKRDKAEKIWLTVENITNGGVTVENNNKFLNWVDHKHSDKLSFEKPYEKKMKTVVSTVAETSAPVENVSDEWQDVIDEFKTTPEYQNCGSNYNEALVKWLSENFYKPRKRN